MIIIITKNPQRRDVMIRVLDEDYRSGIQMSEMAHNCQHSSQCLWGTFKQCPHGGEKDCLALVFRRKFEYDSPLFFKIYVDLSKYNIIISNWNQAVIEGTDEQKAWAVKEKEGLRYFIWASLKALAPLYFANSMQMPLVLSEDLEEFFPDIKDTKYIEKALEKFLIEEADIEEEFKCMGERWFSTAMGAIRSGVYSQKYSHYAKSICLLLKIFRKGLEREKGAINGFKSQGEKDELIKKIEILLGLRNQ